MRDQPDQVTIAVRAADAVVVDYRLLHGTHGNDWRGRRDCVLLSLAPSWSELSADLRAHLIQHPALPTSEEWRAAATSWLGELLPRFIGPPADIEVNVTAPARFAVVEPFALESAARP